MAYFRNAQSFYLGGPRTAAAAAYTITGTLETDLLLEDLVIDASTQHMIDDVRVAGQSIFASDKGCPVTAFAPNSWLSQTGHKSAAIPLASRQQVSISGNAASAFGGGGATVAGFAWGTAPIAPEAVIPVNQLGGEALSYVVGLGEVNIAAGATGVLTCTIRRPVMLGAMVIDFDGGGPSTDSFIRSITVNNVEMLSGESGAAGEVPISAVGPNSSDIDGKLIAYPAALNSQVSVTIVNNSGGAINYAGAIFTLPSAS